MHEQLHHDRYPRSSAYPTQWVADHHMGPHPLWLVEALTQAVEPQPGMRVLDLGCGTALTSIFLAREFGVQVWAADLWVDPTDNFARISEAGVAGQVLPLRAEARDLPFAEDYFDLVVSVDAYHYFGTDDLYLDYLLTFLRPGATIGIVVPALWEEVGPAVPAHLEPYWQPEFRTLHGPRWWHDHWARSQAVDIDLADAIPDGWRDWLRWVELVGPLTSDPDLREGFRQEAAMLEADRGSRLGFARVVARRR